MRMEALMLGLIQRDLAHGFAEVVESLLRG
jgi:hypothetical protein